MSEKNVTEFGLILEKEFRLKISLVDVNKCEFLHISLDKKMKFSIIDFFSKCDQIRSHLLKKSLMENFIFCAVFTKEIFEVNLLGGIIGTFCRKKIRRALKLEIFVLFLFSALVPFSYLTLYHQKPQKSHKRLCLLRKSCEE